MALARVVVDRLLPAGPLTVVVDDTLFHRAGKKVWAAGWFHDGSAKGQPAGRLWRQLGHRRPRLLLITCWLPRPQSAAATPIAPVPRARVVDIDFRINLP
ncbi:MULTISPECIES: hypothetical protein [Frankia]|uniref:hypothetical protein n=1 Tax=Frankia TaxID=1854 RepID=UPI0009FD9DA6|nr:MULTISPECIES: hypothetical protein [Frankia]